MCETRSKTHFQGGIFHIYNRGIDGRSIFLDEDDYRTYMEQLAKLSHEYAIAPVAYCLMPNHVHLLLRQDGDDPASLLIGRLHTAHAKRFNAKHRRFGHLYQGRFKQVVVRSNAQLRHVIAYIHLNPIESGITASTAKYPWSSHAEYLDSGSSFICDTTYALTLFGGKSSYQTFLKETLERPASRRWSFINELTFA